MTPTTTSGAAIQPVLWVSPEQFANFMDADEAQFGRYVPARKTSAGNFTMPLFAARAPAPAQPAAPIKTLTEAIAHAEDKAKGNSACAMEHAKLAAWLTELQLLRAARTAPGQADSVLEDAALWRWLAEYLVGTRTDLDDEIVASETVNDLRNVVKAAIKQGEKQ